MKRKSRLLLAACAFLSLTAHADEIKISIVTGITGTIAATVQDLRVVNQAYIAPKPPASIAGEGKISGIANSQMVPNRRSTNLRFVRNFSI